jgi:lipopolysaccharide heptosyltransferase II
MIMPAPDENILVRSVNWLGDAVMSTPALLRLRQARPAARLTLLCPEKLAGLWERQPFVDELLTFSAGENPWRVARRLRETKFTAGLAFPNSFRSALELWLARIPRRAGAAGGGRSFLLTQPVPPPPGAVEMRKRSAREIRRLIGSANEPALIPPAAHHVHHYLNLSAALGASPEPLPPRIDVSEQEMEAARSKFGLTPNAGRPWFGVAPGAEYGAAKRWPADRFVAAALALRRKTNCRWAVFGSAAERDLAGSIAAEIGRAAGEPALDLAGKTTLRELAAALKICHLVLTNDTGPMHLAAAVGSPVTAVFGSTSPGLTGPIFSPQARVVRWNAPCAPCFRRDCPIDLRCLRELPTETVLAAALQCAEGKISALPG